LSQPTLAVLNAIYLLGAHISNDKTIATEESRYLSQALQQKALSMSRSHPKKILYIIQADILLAQYFFRNCRFFEGWCHLTSAASLANGAGLHQISSGTVRPQMQLVDDAEIRLPAARDIIDEGERINAFWIVFIMDKCWSIVLGCPSSITDVDALGSQVYTPWPLDVEKYELVCVLGVLLLYSKDKT